MRKSCVALVSVVVLLALVGAAPATAKPAYPGTCTVDKNVATCVETTHSIQTYLLDSWQPAGTFIGYDTNPFVVEWCNALFPNSSYTWTKAWTWQNEYETAVNNGEVLLSKTTTTTTTTTYRGRKVISQSADSQVGYRWDRVTPDSQLDCLDDDGHSIRLNGWDSPPP